MAFGINLLTAAADDVARTTYTTASVSPSANSTLLVFCTSRMTSADADQIVTTVAGHSLTWTKEAGVSHDPAGTASHMACWRAETGSSPGSGTITLTSVNAATGCHWHVYEVTDSDLTSGNGVIQSKTNSATSGNYITTTFDSAPAADSAVLQYCSIQSSVEKTLLPEVGFVKLAEVSVSENEQTAVQFIIGSSPTGIEQDWQEGATGGIGGLNIEVGPDSSKAVVRAVDLGADDAHIDGTQFFNAEISMYWGQWETAAIQHIMLRFDPITIPEGAIIDAAYVSLYFDTRLNGTDDLDATVHAEDDADADTLANYTDWTNRTTTTANVTWTLDDGGWTDGTWNTSGDIKTVIQEIVNLGGWATGQAIMLYLEDEGPTPVGNEAKFGSFEGGNAPYLTIEFSEASPGSVLPIFMQLIAG